MAEKKLDIDAKLAKVRFVIDKEAHIKVDKIKCPDCELKPCLTACPAENYTWDEAKDELNFDYEGCLECGTCRLICPEDAIDWSYPRGGFGVAFKWG